MVSRQDSVQVWASQLSAGDFPPICAMTGAPAETWRKCRFSTAPSWAFVFVFLLCVGIGFFLTGPLIYLVGRHANGKLPLTRQSARNLELPVRVGIPVTVTAVVLLVISALSGLAHNLALSFIGLLCFDFGSLSLVIGVFLLQVGMQRVRSPVGLSAKVMKQEAGQLDRLVKLIRVHPNFVAAVQQMQSAPPQQSTERT